MLNSLHRRCRPLYAALPLLVGGMGLARGTQSPYQNHILYLPAAKLEDAQIKRRVADFAGQEPAPFVLVMETSLAFPVADRRLTPRSPMNPEGREWAAQLRSAPALVLTGGTFMQWYDTVYARGPRTYLAAALDEFYTSRKPLIAQGGGCAFLSGGVLIDPEQLPDPERNPRRKGVFKARLALGIGPECLFDGNDWPDNSPLRLLQAMLDTGVDLGVFFVGQVALDFDRVSRQHEVLGGGRLLLFDLRRARSTPTGIREGRLSLLGSGDRWRSTEARLRPAARRRWVSTRPAQRPTGVQPSDWSAQPGPRAAQLMRWIEAPTSERETRAAGASTWTLGWDSHSRGESEAPPGAPRTWLELPFDCLWPKR